MRYDAVIAIEKLKHLRKRNGKGRKPKKANRRIHRIPFHKFRTAIQSVAWQHGIDVVEVPAAKTSQRCPKCGYTSKKNRIFFSGKRKLFKEEVEETFKALDELRKILWSKYMKEMEVLMSKYLGDLSFTFSARLLRTLLLLIPFKVVAVEAGGKVLIIVLSIARPASPGQGLPEVKPSLSRCPEERATG